MNPSVEEMIVQHQSDSIFSIKTASSSGSTWFDIRPGKMQSGLIEWEKLMEHRNSRRIDFSIDAHLTYRDVVIPKCKVVNANSGGILITASELELPKLVLVRVTLKFDRIRPAVNLRPLVVHSSVGRAGLWFYQNQQDWQKIWHELIKTRVVGEQSIEIIKTPALLYVG